ncbi:2-dehydropantoate 2-reductase [Verticiella sediminum]|uniref:2-dehydropantoate 2-reductase n=1 Tax=Verticiella sediminum TaxID=1247510 RepID=A0A556AW52_9BURK|nr:2-dehydropantoate 2-reductase [Verticiella sediminum]TSH97157.1 2-dehydropantoate 2-reductase [Verticiella sediminum]
MSAATSHAEAPLRIGVAGAGAIGCTLAAVLARGGQQVSLLARGATLRAIAAGGVRLTDAAGTAEVPVRASDSAAALGVQDVVFVCTKAQDVAGILPALAPMIGPDTTIVPLINGVPWWYFQGLPGRLEGRAVAAVDPQGVLAGSVRREQLVGAVVFITAERVQPAEVVSPNPMLIILGELAHMETPRVRRIAAALDAAGIEARVSPAIRDALWTKVLANLTSNPLSVVSGGTLQQIYSDPRLLPIARKMLDEGLALAAAYGARIVFDPPTFIAQGAAMGPIRTSMLQDALHGRPLELAAIGDAVLELAELQGIPMPVTRDVIGLARFREDAMRASRS